MSHGDGFGTAILYKDQAELLLSFLKVLQGALPTGSWRADLAWWRSHPVCPACRELAGDRERYIAVLVEGLRDAGMRSAFDGSPGLCVPHFLAALEASRDAGVRSHLGETQRAKTGDLLRDLDEFCRKQDYRFQAEGIGKEGDSWVRAVRMLVGDDGVF